MWKGQDRVFGGFDQGSGTYVTRSPSTSLLSVAVLILSRASSWYPSAAAMSSDISFVSGGVAPILKADEDDDGKEVADDGKPLITSLDGLNVPINASVVVIMTLVLTILAIISRISLIILELKAVSKMLFSRFRSRNWGNSNFSFAFPSWRTA